MQRDGVAPFVAQETIGGAVMGVGGDEWRDLQARCNGPRPSAWIDVRERLPETSVDVLAWEDYSAIPDGWSGVSVCVYKTAEWQDGEGFPATVTHWQPLPPPPEVKRYASADGGTAGATVAQRDMGPHGVRGLATRAGDPDVP